MSERLLVVSVAAINEPHRRAYDAVARVLGWDVHIGAPERIRFAPNNPPVVVAPRPDGARYELHALIHHFYEQSRLHWFSGLGRLIRRLRPDIVFVEYDPGCLTVLQAKMPPVGQHVIALTVENMSRHRFRDMVTSARRGDVKGVARDALVGSLLALGWRATDGLACISTESKRIFKSQGWKKPVEVMPLGTDVQAFCPGDERQLRSDLGLDQAFVVGYFGRLVPEKGVHVLIDAVARTSGEVVLLLDLYANFAPGSYADQLLWQASKLGIRDCIRTIDVPHADVPRYMRCCDTVVLPSLTTERWKEQFGRVLPEAMACEVPVIGTSSGNIPEMIGEAGIIVPEADSAALALAIVGLQRDPQRRVALGKAGRRRVIEQFSLESQARALERLAAQL
jgi:glycosyltransferase involved in cell wall biosynthesis